MAQETVVLLLEFNPDISPLLDWVVDRCYTGNAQVADGCFLALATIFSAREYPCDHYTAIINVTLMSTGCPRTIIHEVALQLLQVNIIVDDMSHFKNAILVLFIRSWMRASLVAAPRFPWHLEI